MTVGKACDGLGGVYISHCKVLKIKPNSIVLRELAGGGREAAVIDISKNYLGDRGVMAFLQVLTMNKTLQTLNLSDNGLMNDTVVALSRTLVTHPSIKNINLSNNPLSLVAATAVIDLVRRNPRVVSVDLSGTFVEDRAKVRLAKMIEKNVRFAKREKPKDGTPFSKAVKEYEDRKRSKPTDTSHPAAFDDVLMMLRSLQPQAPRRDVSGWVILNVFISSTSVDFKTELRAIHEDIIPRLNEHLRPTKVYLQPLSVYYGENVALTEPDHSLDTLLAERLKLVSMCSPMFTMLVGDRYGPVPGYIPPSTADTLPPNKEALPLPVLEAHYGGLTNPSSAALYFVRHGARCLAPPQGIIEALSDDYSYLNTDPEGRYSPAVPLPTHKEPSSTTPEVKKTRWEMWKTMKNTILALSGPMVLRKYKSQFSAVAPTGEILLKGQETFNEEYYNRLLAVVTYLYNDTIHTGQKQIVEKKWKEHASDAEHIKAFVYGTSPVLGRKNAISKLELYVVSPASRNIFLLRAPPGGGLTSIMAIFVQKCLKKETCILPYFFIGHSGLASEPTDLRTVLLTLCKNMTDEDLPLQIQNEVNMRVIKDYFRATLNETASALKEGHLLVIALDGLDKLQVPVEPPAEIMTTNTGKHILESADETRHAPYRRDTLDWIPVCLPKNVRLIVSCAADSPLAAQLIARGQDSCEEITITPPGTADVEHAIVEKLAGSKISLSKLLLDDLLNKQDIRFPLYCKLVANRVIQRWEAGYPAAPSQFIQAIPETTTELIGSMLEYAETCASASLVGDALCCIALMPEGLLLFQLREILVKQGKGRTLLSGKKLASLMHGIRPFLTDVIGLPPWNGMALVMQMLSAQFKERVLARYAPTEEDVLGYYSKLTQYLYTQSEEVDHPLTAAALRTYPYTMVRAQQWANIITCIFNIRTVRQAFQHDVGYVHFREMLRAVAALWAATEQGTSGVGEYTANEVRGWLHKMKEYIHFVHANIASLSTRPHLAIQQGLQCQDESNVYIEARKYFEHNPTEPHFTCTNKKTLKLNKGVVTALSFSKNGLRVLAAAGRSFSLCNVVGDVLHQITLNSSVNKAMVSATSRYVLAVLSDKTISLYDAVTGTSVSRLLGHTGHIRAVDMSNRSRFVISGSDDGTLKVWGTETGKLLADIPHNVFCASSSAFTAVSCCVGHPTDENMFLSAVDKVALMWKKHPVNTDYELVHRLTAHTSCPVKRVEYLQNGEYVLTCVRRPAGGVGGESGASTTPLQDTAIKVFSAMTGELVSRVHGTDHAGIVSTAVSPNETFLAAALEDGSVVFWQLAYKDKMDLHPVKTIKAYEDTASLVGFCIMASEREEPEEGGVPEYLAVTCGDSNMLNTYYTSDWSPAAEYVFHNKAQTLDCAAMPTCEGAQVVVGDFGGNVYLLRGHRLTR